MLKRRKLFIGIVLSILVTTTFGDSEKCNGPYMGKKIPLQDLKKILSVNDEWKKNYDLVSHREEYGIDRESEEWNRIILRQASLEASGFPRKVNLSGVRFKGADLTGVNFDFAILCLANFERAKLSKASFDFSTLRQANFSQADLSDASFNSSNLYRADFDYANLTGTHFFGASLIEVTFHNAKLEETAFNKANLIGASFLKSDIKGVYFDETNLRDVRFLSTNLNGTTFFKAILDGTDFIDVDFENVIFEPLAWSLPPPSFFFQTKSLTTLRYIISPQALVELRNNFKTAGYREHEREITYVLEREETARAFWFEKLWRVVFFDWTTKYGLYPGRSLYLLFGSIIAFAMFYLIPLSSWNRSNSFVAKVWPKDRVISNKDSFQLAKSEKIERLCATGFVLSGYAIYFSILSAFHFGWRDLNVGTWISRMQPREYALRGVRWIRLVSGFQSLLSVYLLAMWMLTYFGRPFG